MSTPSTPAPSAPTTTITAASAGTTPVAITATPPSDESITPEEAAELESSGKEEQKQDVKEKSDTSVGKRKIKVDGQELELTQEEIDKYASLGKAAHKRMQEAAEVNKKFEKLEQNVDVFLEMLKSNPERVLADMGHDVKALAEAIMNKEVEEAAKTPEQKEKEELLRKLEEAENKNKEAESEKKRIASEKMNNEIASQIEKDINDAIESNKAPKDPEFVRKVADLLLLATAKGIDVSAADVIPLAVKHRTEHFKATIPTLSDEELENMLGKDRISALRRRYLQKLKQPTITAKDVKSTGLEEKNKKNEEKQKISSKDFFNKLGSF